MINKLLLIVDPQIDFITGVLPVPGAVSSMNSLAGYLRRNSTQYVGIIVTADRHPMRHCSFRTEAGQWPVHCVADSVGAAIWPPLMSALIDASDKTAILHKGENAETEEYSIFKNRDAADIISHIIKSRNIGHIDICGVAGDVCVAATIRDLLTLDDNIRLNVLKKFSPSIDGGNTLDSLISKYSLSCTG